MQHRYAADIGDFGKFHLLRFLFNHTGYKLKQVWYLYPNESHNNDGLHINYFDKVKGVDTLLEEAFQQIIQNNTRNVKALQVANLIACDYFEEYVSKGIESLSSRKTWLNKAVQFVEKTDYTFVDPDNGLATKLIKTKTSKDIQLLGFENFKQRTKQGKYIFLDEIKAFYQCSRCVVVYHHLNRTMSHDNQIMLIQNKLREQFYEVMAIKHKPYSPRVYFFILKDKYITYFIRNNLQKFQEHFSNHWQLFVSQ